MQDGKILYAIVDGTCMLKLVGAIIYSLSPDFDSFLDKIVRDKEVDSFTVDLTETSYIDSTNLGLLAKLPKFSPDRSSGPPTLISNQNSINEVLYNVGFSKIFNIIDDIDEHGHMLAELPKIESNQDDLSRTVIKAHRELVQLNETNRDRFNDVITYLEKDVSEPDPAI